MRGRQREGRRNVRGRDTNRNASRRRNGDLVVSIICDVIQSEAGMLKNDSIVGMRFHDCKYGLLGLERSWVSIWWCLGGVRVEVLGVRGKVGVTVRC